MPIIFTFLGCLTGIVALFAMRAYAFHIRDHHPERYKGFWRYWGNINRSPILLTGIAIGSILGYALTIGIGRLLQPNHVESLTILLIPIIIFVVILAIMSIIMRYNNRNRDR